jgi:hypothetical protein
MGLVLSEALAVLATPVHVTTCCILVNRRCSPILWRHIKRGAVSEWGQRNQPRMTLALAQADSYSTQCHSPPHHVHLIQYSCLWPTPSTFRVTLHLKLTVLLFSSPPGS